MAEVTSGTDLTVFKEYWIIDEKSGEVISSVMLRDEDWQEFLDLVEEQVYYLSEEGEA